jgi:hypothetical protein
MDGLEAIAGAGEAVPVALLVRREVAVAELQARLAHHGLLDPPADGLLDPATQWALAAFCAAAGTPFEGGLHPSTAKALLAPTPVLPVHPGTDLAGRVAAALLRRGDPMPRHPDLPAIVYVEGLDLDGRAISRRPDAFDDLRLLLRIAPGGRPEILGAWEATTASGRPAVEEPAEPQGAPRLARGWHRAWVLGRTAIGTELEQEALVQVAPLPVTRDADRDFHRGGDPQERGLYVIDQHGGFDAPRERVGGIGAGCLVGRAQAGHGEFLAALRRDPRWQANAAWRFGTSILGAEEL